MIKRNNSAAADIIGLVVIVLAIIGWVMNIYTLFHMHLTEVTGEMMVRIIGVFVAPIGAIVGWF